SVLRVPAAGGRKQRRATSALPLGATTERTSQGPQMCQTATLRAGSRMKEAAELAASKLPKNRLIIAAAHRRRRRGTSHICRQLSELLCSRGCCGRLAPVRG